MQIPGGHPDTLTLTEIVPVLYEFDESRVLGHAHLAWQGTAIALRICLDTGSEWVTPILEHLVPKMAFTADMITGKPVLKQVHAVSLCMKFKDHLMN